LEIDPLILSFELAVIATALAALVGITVSAVLANFRFPGRDILDVIFTAPLVMPPTVLGYYLLVALGNEWPIGQAYHWLTGSQIVFTKVGAIIAASVAAVPLVVKSVRTALEETDRTLVLAARTLGATPLRAFFTIQLPLAWRGIVAALMLAFARAIGDFGITYMVGGNIPRKTKTASIAIYDLIQAQHDRDAALMIALLTILVFTMLYVVNKLTAKPREGQS
jgi:molybdate transport system permease protein